MLDRAFGFYALPFWGMIFCNVVVPQLLWFRGVRANLPLLILISIFVLIGMWLERFVIIVIGLHQTYLPTMQRVYTPRTWDIIAIIAPFGLFMVLMYLFIRLLPLIPMFETQELMQEGRTRGVPVDGDVTGD